MKPWIFGPIAILLAGGILDCRADQRSTPDSINRGKELIVGQRNPSYFFNKVIQIDTQLLVGRIIDQTNTNTPGRDKRLCINLATNISNTCVRHFSFSSVQESEVSIGDIITVSDDEKYIINRQNSGFLDSITNLEAKYQELAARVAGNAIIGAIRADNNNYFESGYCLGVVLWAGTVVEILKVRDEANVGKFVTSSVAVPGSALCAGPVARTPPDLPLNSPDLRALRETMLLITGLVPYDCQLKPAAPGAPAGGPPIETCSFDRPRVEPRP